MLAELLFSERAPLYKRLVIEEQKVDSISGSNDLHVDPNLFTVLARLKRPEHLAEVEKAIDAEIARIAREGVDEQTLEEVLSNIRYGFAQALTTADRVAGIGAQFIALAGELEAVNAYYAQYPRSPRPTCSGWRRPTSFPATARWSPWRGGPREAPTGSAWAR